MDGRHLWVIGQLAEAFELREQVVTNAISDNYKDALDEFWTPSGPKKLVFVYQQRENTLPNGQTVVEEGSPELLLTTGENITLRGKAVYFIRLSSKGVTDKTVEQDVAVGEVQGTALDAFRSLVSDLYLPLLREQPGDTTWGKAPEEASTEFMQGAQRLVSVLTEAAQSLTGGVELRKPDRKYAPADGPEPSPAVVAKAANDAEGLAHFDALVSEWCVHIGRLVDDTDSLRREPDDAGPSTELAFWRDRMAQLNSVLEQLKAKEARLALEVCAAARSAGHTSWRACEGRFTEAVSEAKDNVKYLTTLEKSFEPLYTGTPASMLESLPAMLNNIKMLHAIARYYGTPQRMTTLFSKVTAQMITNCRQFLLAPGKLYDQDKPTLLGNLELPLRLNDSFQEQYRAIRDKLAEQPDAKPWAFDERKIFIKFDLFAKRCSKLSDLFATIHQFAMLAQQTHIDGLEEIIKSFFVIVDDFKRRPYDLLDYQKSSFDRDLLEFNVSVSEMEGALQAFINSSFDNMQSTEHALSLLRQLRAVLQRDALRADLDEKYMVIFQNYGLDLDAVQKAYEKHKHSPPLARNAPPVAGNIAWSRQLLRRIEEPMRKFAANPAIVATKEYKRIVKTYNRVAAALVEFEALWHRAWVKSVDAARQGLNATLLVRHPDTGALLVNFDRDVAQLLRETRCLLAMGVEVPEPARMVLLQEDKFKRVHGQLAHVIKEYTRILEGALPVAKPLLRPHLEDLDRAISGGLTTLTWTSLNIEAYLARIYTGLASLEELVRKIDDIIDNRVESNLKAMGNTRLVDLPQDKSFTFDDFVAHQSDFIKARTGELVVRNQEVQRAVQDLLDMVERFPRDNRADSFLSPEDHAAFRRHYSRLTYIAIRSSIRASLGAMKSRLTRRPAGLASTPGGLPLHVRPLFDVELELVVPSVSLRPSLDDIQGAVNAIAKRVLRAALELPLWSTEEQDAATAAGGFRPGTAAGVPASVPEERPATSSLTTRPGSPRAELSAEAAAGKGAFTPRSAGAPEGGAGNAAVGWKLVRVHFTGAGTHFDLIARDHQITRAVLMLAGCVAGAKADVLDFVSTFTRYDFLWKLDLAAEYAAFMRTQPTVDGFEAELRKYMALEQEVAGIAATHTVGALRLHTGPLRASFKSEAAAWKTAFAKNLHSQALEDLRAMHDYMRDATLKLGQKIEDLEDVRGIMDLQRELRDREAEIDTLMTPIEEIYALLGRYEVRVPREETDLLADLRPHWRKLLKLSDSVSDTLAGLQEGFKHDLVREVKSFVADVVSFRGDWEVNGPMVHGLDPIDAADRLKKFQQLFELRKRKWDNYRMGEELFGMAVTSYPELERTEREIALLDRLYALYLAVLAAWKGFAEVHWSDLGGALDGMTDGMNAFSAQAKKMPKSLREWPAYQDCKKRIDDFLALVPLLQALLSKAMRPRHWEQLQTITGKALDLREDVFLLAHIFESDLLAHGDDVEDLTISAVKEEQIELKLAAIAAEWSAQAFTFTTYKTRGTVVLEPAPTVELVERLEDSQMTLASISTNRYSAFCRDEVAKWITKLSVVSEVIEGWLVVQNMWMYMEAVFSGGDIVKQLPMEAKRFANIDKNYMKAIQTANEILNVVGVCYGNDVMRGMLPGLTEQLEQCQKSLTAFLDTKRAEFPRFYFVSDPTLLEILSLGSDPAAVQHHFQSGLFDSLATVTFDKADKTKMLAMHSSTGETVKLVRLGADKVTMVDNPVLAQGNIEAWLQALVNGMQGTVKANIKRAPADFLEQELETFIFSHPAQVSLLGLQFAWTADVQAGLTAARNDKNVMAKALRTADGMLRDLITITTKTNLSKNERTNVETCITVHVHQRDTTEDLVAKRVKDPTDFEWLKQARFYWRAEQDTVIISICDVDFEYSYEYLGVKERLVITPLTDICYVTLSQALGMYLGGAPAGPAGTGKTETTKDLGATLGKYVVVFNCSDQMDYKGMGKIYRGLAQSGLWGCFDEFNRINLDVLSVCAQQVFCVLNAIRERKNSFVFTDGSIVSLDPRVGFFITMNPGYAGRQELPENLKSLFRGVTMMVPNRQIIMKVKLAACGYQDNDLLSKKFFVLYGLCEQQLSKQAHYDFGLRNILSVLRTMGSSKRANPEKSEVYLVMRTLRDMNMSKFVAEDVPLFLSLIDDLFPGIRADKATFADVEAAIQKQVKDRGLQQHPSWLAKCVQLYETYQVRHGIMLVGPTGSGKSTIMDVLAAALTDLGQKHVIWRMNPKAITAPQMFGRLDAATGDWTDGIFAVLWRRAARAKNQHTWIVLDGPVDAIWIENLNTVLDDNKVLTLANGDRVQMSSTMKAMFEPENLNNASPATVSRAGIIYVSDSELGWKPLAASWLQQRRPGDATVLRPCFDKFVAPVLEFVRLECRNTMPGAPWPHVSRDMCQVTTLLTLLGAALKAGAQDGGEPRQLSERHLERLFLYCTTWALGGLLTAEDRPKFSAKVRSLAPAGDMMPPKGEEHTLFDYFVDDETAEWALWESRVPAWVYPAGVERPKYASLVIPTVDSVRYEHLLTMCASVGAATLLVGGPGTAKTTIVAQYMGKLNPDTHTSKSITFSSLTTPNIFQFAIEGSVEKRQGKTYGPAGGKKMAVFIDDISMPDYNDWGDQVTNEAVRQLLETGALYQLEKPIGDQKGIVDCCYIAAMNTPGGGKNDIPNRLKRHFACFNVPLPSPASIQSVFGTLVAGRFDPETFGDDVVTAAAKLVPATVELWTRVQAKMLPTPAKFHYLFNMRELSKVFQGVLLASRDRFRKAATLPKFGGDITSCDGYLVALWRHECERVFCDKLTNAADKTWTEGAIMELVGKTFGPDISIQVERRVMFVDFLREPTLDPDTGEQVAPAERCYEAIDMDALRAVVDAKQRQHNEGSRSTKFELVLFDNALEHLCRIARLLACERGSALLVGVGGSGKQSLTRLAAYLAGAVPFQITVTKQYNQQALFEDIKAMYKLAGFKGQKVAFIFTDSEVKEESFLEYINQILMTGAVAGLFARDELDQIVSDIRPVMKRESPELVDTYDNLYAFFMGRVRDNLHVILCFSPVGAKFSKRAAQFPGLINGCTVDWFLPWPVDALTAVAGKLVGDFQIDCLPEVKAHLVEHMGHIHTSVTAACTEYFDKYRRRVYVTPKSYLSFIAGYKALYTKKLGEVQALSDKISNGLAKLLQAKTDVGQMKVELAHKNLELAEAQRVSANLLKEISASTAVAEKEKAKVAVIVAEVTAKATEIARVKEDAENDLAAAKPALDAAVDALNSVTAKDIGALKALKNPPDVIKRIFDTVLVLRQWAGLDKVSYQDVKGAMVVKGSWDTSVRMMSESAFLQSLVEFPKELITDETCELLEPYFSAPDYNFASAQKASGNVAGLCNWCKAMYTYHYIAKAVEPKIVRMHEAEAELKLAMREKDGAESKMAEVQAELDRMQAEFDSAMGEKARLEEDAANTRKRMDAANALIAALAGEEARWTAQSAEFAGQIQRLIGDCAMAASFISYLGPFNKEFRELLLSRDFYGDLEARGVPVTKGLEVSHFLVEESERGEWTLQGLPTDELSVQNGLMVARATRYPVLVDPQGQGLTWLKRREEGHGLRVTSLGDKNFRAVLEDCLSNGKSMLVENIEEDLDPVLDPVLEKRYIRKGRTVTIALADKEVDFDENFALFFTTRLPNPHYSPELSAKVTVVDFTVTNAGLEDQLLNRLILKEKAELEEQRKALVEEVTAYKRKIKQLEDDLLFRLSNSTGNLLDDTELIDVLAITKRTAQEVNERLATASDTNKKITEACEEYRPVAHRAMLIYFLIAEFATVNCMYQTSLAQFMGLYEAAIDRAEHAAMPSKRIHNVIEYLTYSVYLYVQRGLFERHKLIFALMLANKVGISAGTLDPGALGVFLRGAGSLDATTARRKPKDWIPDSAWLNVLALATLPVFAGLAESVTKADAAWRLWYDLEAPEKGKMPDGFEAKLSKFERTMLIKALRPDRTLVAATEYITEQLGARFVESVPVNLEATWQESRNRVPLICLLSPGADPTRNIEDLAKRKKIKVLGVSMGQGQELIARKLMATATVDGQWVLLQNTHLGLGYLSEVEQFLLKAEDIHDDFRLWITAEPHPAFPIGLLQMGIKITNEAPVGMRAGLRASYAWVNQDMVDAVPRAEWRQLLFVQCFLHSIVQERRKFGPIGWNVPYEFNQGDLSACVQFLQNHLTDMDTKKAAAPTWATVQYMVSAIQYGGRITDDFDQLLMDTYTAKFFNQAVLAKGFEMHPGYRIQDNADIAVVRAEIEKLPGTDSPEIFGMHPNADLTYRTLMVQAAIDTIVETMPKTVGHRGGLSREDTVDKLCEELLAKMPAPFDPEVVKERLRKLPGGNTQPLTIHLRQEIDRMNIIVDLAYRTLTNLRLAIAGTVALSGDLIHALDALFDARIPAVWLKKSWEASNLSIWFAGLLARHTQLDKWLNTGRPKSFWLTGFFNPQGFLTAVKQEISRKHAADKWALDDMVVVSEVLHPPRDVDQLKEEPKEGVYIHGLFLDGCAWSTKEGRLVDSEPKKLFCPLPVMCISGVLAKDRKPVPVYSAPCYTNKRRTGATFITQFDLRIDERDAPQKWILRGVALLASID